MRTAGTFEAETLPPPHTVALGWKSTVPIYLFGGLAAMLGLIAFALLILACSYWKLSGYRNSGDNAGERKPDDGGATEKGGEVVLNSVLVIMAGDQKPTFLATATATPAATSRASSIGGGSSRIGADSSGDGDGRREKEVGVELSSSSMRTTM